jgi:hypothetical protein
MIFTAGYEEQLLNTIRYRFNRANYSVLQDGALNYGSPQGLTYSITQRTDMGGCLLI